MRPRIQYARSLLTGLPVRLETSGGNRLFPQPCSRASSPEWWIAPGLVDTQVNGFAGTDFQQAGLALPQLLDAVSGLLGCGCTRFFVTLVSDDWDAMLERLRELRELRAAHPLLRGVIAGWHFEGPFLSNVPGYHGAHPAEKQIDPKPSHFRALRKVAGSDPLIVTLAPERRGALHAIQTATQLGIAVSLGHTKADAPTIHQAINSGATGFTHLGNACPQLLDRHDNVLWNILDQTSLRISLIPDSIHVSPPLFRLIHRAYPASRIHYITDAMAAAGAGPGQYQLADLTVEVGSDGIVRQPGKTNFAGSSLTPIEGVRRAFRMLCPQTDVSGRNLGPDQQHLLASVWRSYSVAPANWLRLRGRNNSGVSPSFCLFRLGTREVVRDLSVFLNGEKWTDLA